MFKGVLLLAAVLFLLLAWRLALGPYDGFARPGDAAGVATALSAAGVLIIAFVGLWIAGR